MSTLEEGNHQPPLMCTSLVVDPTCKMGERASHKSQGAQPRMPLQHHPAILHDFSSQFALTGSTKAISNFLTPSSFSRGKYLLLRKRNRKCWAAPNSHQTSLQMLLHLSSSFLLIPLPRKSCPSPCGCRS